jgi:hypothetical protein
MSTENIDSWSLAGPRIDAPEIMSRLRAALEDEGPLTIEHRFLRGASAPHRFICEDYDQLVAYLKVEVRAGDAIWVWDYAAVCRDDNALTHGKKPDQMGRTPERGPY